MNILQLPINQPVLVDTNILVYANQHISNQCVKFLEKCAKGEALGILPTNELTKLIQILMIAEAKDLGIIKIPYSIKQLNKNPNKVKSLNRYESLIKDLLSIGLQIETNNREDFLTSLRIQRQYGLALNDAIFLAIAERLRVTAIVSTNSLFANVQGVILYSPDDIITE